MIVKPLVDKAVKSPMICFFVVGLALWLLQQGVIAPLDQDNRVFVGKARVNKLIAQWEKETGRAPEKEELKVLVESFVEEEILVKEALLQRVVEIDPIIQTRLEKNLQFIGDEQSQGDVPLWRKAIAMGMHETDPVVRRRLVQIMENRMKASIRLDVPDQTILENYLAENRDRYRSHSKWDLKQVFFNISQPDSDKNIDPEHASFTRAEKIREGLLDGSIKDPLPLADVTMIPAEFTRATQRQIERYLGSELTTVITKMPFGEWSHPVKSPFGWHLIYVSAKEPGSVPGLNVIGKRVFMDWKNDFITKELRRSKRALVKEYDVIMNDSGTLKDV